MNTALDTLRTHGQEAIISFAEGKEQVNLLAGLNILISGFHVNPM